jgi:PAS domain-containing protein
MEVARFRSQFFILLEQLSMQYRQAQQTLANIGREIGYTVRVAGKTVHARKYYWPELRRTGTAAIVLTNRGIESIKPHISALLTKVALVGQRTQDNLVEPVVYKALSLGQAVHTRRYYWPVLQKGGALVIAAISAGIANSTAYLAELSKRTSGHVRQAGQKVANTGREIASKPHRARDARKARENDLLNLMETSLDAIVVTDDAHRFVAANTNALQLFGVSYANIKNFTLDSFIANAQVAGFNGHSASKTGNCKIRRLDGKVRLAEYEFTANHVPFRHLCIFRSARSKPVGSIARTDTVRFQ